MPLNRSLAVLLLVAVAVKVIYFTQYLTLPILNGPAFDSLAYLRQARAIVDGRFDDASLIAFSPLYGYALALIGAHEHHVRIVVFQLLLGCLNLVLVYHLAERLFDRRAAFVSTALYLTYGLLVFYETKLMAETLGLSLSLLTLWLCTDRAVVGGRVRVALVAGSVFALALLARSNLLLVAPFVLLALLLPWRQTAPRFDDDAWSVRLRRTLGFALGLALVLGANGTWNHANTGLFVPVILRSATASRASTATWDGNLSAFSNRADGNVGVFDVISQAEARLAGRAAVAPDAGIDVVGVIAAAPRKFSDTFRNVETDFQYGYYGERTEVPIFGVMSGSFGMLGVLAFVGIAELFRTRRSSLLIPLAPWALGAVATTILIHPSSRYRMPLVLALLPLAGVGAVWLWDQRRDRRSWPIIAPVVLACGYFTHATLNYELKDPAMWQLRMAESALSASDLEEAERRIARAQAIAGDKPHIRHRIEYLRGRSP